MFLWKINRIPLCSFTRKSNYVPVKFVKVEQNHIGTSSFLGRYYVGHDGDFKMLINYC